MFGSAILEVAIGVLFVFLLVSIICTAVREGIETLLKTRAAYLERGIREFLGGPAGAALTQAVYEHPRVYALFRGPYAPGSAAADGAAPGLFARGGTLPSYIPSRTFVSAWLDVVTKRWPELPGTQAAPAAVSLTGLRDAAAALGDARMRRVLLDAIDDAQGSLDAVRTTIERQFDDAMDRVSGWYQRASRKIVFGIGLVVAVSMNVDVFEVARHLYRDTALRTAAVTMASATVENASDVSGIDDAPARLGDLSLPIGWTEATVDALNAGDRGVVIAGRWLSLAAGWLVVAFASTLGAPFWFDVLKKFMQVRSTTKPPTAETASPVTPAAAPAASTDSTGAASRSAAMAAPRVHADGDTCDVDMTVDPTPDENLPAARGGVAVAP
jgi:hypothetical protein